MANRSDFKIYLKTDRCDLVPQNFHGHIYLNHNEQFGIVIENNSNLKVKAHFFLSGESVGVLIVNPRSIEVLKRPIVGVDRCFQYCAFGTKTAVYGKLNEYKPHSDEITVIIRPQKPTESQDNICVPECADYGVSSSKSITIETDGPVSNRGGIVLNQNISHQKFKLAKFFETRGEYYYTLLLRTIKESLTTNQVIPLCEMMDH